jgi:dTDP-4-dehydrorhamnose reductase
MHNVYASVLIVGHNGMLANAVRRALANRGVSFVGVGRDACDVTDEAHVRAAFEGHRPTLVFNCTAATNVDGCEADPAGADRLNGDAVRYMATAAKASGAVLVHYSTDFVFGGDKHGAYRETDPTGPLSAYGRSKLLGENHIREIAPPGYLILRTAWLYGTPGKCFPRTMVELAKKPIDPLRVVGDQRGCPTLTDDLAAATLELIDKGQSGVFHATNSGATTWCDFARAVMEEWGLPNRVEALTSAQWKEVKPNSAHRPANSVLELGKIEAALGRKMRPWREALADYRRQTEARGF